MEQYTKHDLLDVYYPRALDTVYDGFLSTFTYDFKPTGSQKKMIVTQSIPKNYIIAGMRRQDTIFLHWLESA